MRVVDDVVAVDLEHAAVRSHRTRAGREDGGSASAGAGERLESGIGRIHRLLLVRLSAEDTAADDPGEYRAAERTQAQAPYDSRGQDSVAIARISRLDIGWKSTQQQRTDYNLPLVILSRQFRSAGDGKS